MRKFLSLAAASLVGATPLVAADGAADAAASAAASAADAGAEAHLVPMDALVVPIVDGGRSAGTLRIKLVLAAADAGAAERIAASLPPLRAASVGAALEFARLYASPMTPVNAERLAGDMTATLRAADAGVRRVLVVEVAAARG